MLRLVEVGGAAYVVSRGIAVASKDIDKSSANGAALRTDVGIEAGGKDDVSRGLLPPCFMLLERPPNREESGVHLVLLHAAVCPRFERACGSQRARKGQRVGRSLLRVRGLRRPSALPTIQSCRSRLGTTPLAAEQCAEADETDVRVRLSLTVGDFRDPQSGSGRRSLGLQCVESGEVGSQRRTNRRGCCSFRVRCSKHAGQPDDISTYRAIGFMFQNNRIMIRHASLCPVLFDAGILENAMQQSRADILLGVNGDRHDSLRFSDSRIAGGSPSPIAALEPVLPEQPNQFRPRHSSAMLEPNVGFVKGWTTWMRQTSTPPHSSR